MDTVNFQKGCESVLFSKGVKKTMTIEGMMCAHCAASVTKALESLKGVKAKIDLKKKQAAVTISGDVTDDMLIKAVTDAGFEVVSVE